MADLTLQELRILRSAGRRQQPAWLIWLPAILGGAGGLGIVVAAAFLRPEPDVRGIAYGFLMTGFLITQSAWVAHNQALSTLIAKLRDRLDRGEKLG
mgnify:CR=1 FL=1